MPLTRRIRKQAWSWNKNNKSKNENNNSRQLNKETGRFWRAAQNNQGKKQEENVINKKKGLIFCDIIFTPQLFLVRRPPEPPGLLFIISIFGHIYFLQLTITILGCGDEEDHWGLNHETENGVP